MSRPFRLFALLLALAPLTVAAQPPAPAEAPLPAWEQLSAEQRETLLAPVRERWNRSSPERRAQMLEHARRWQAMTPEQREHARKGMHRWHDLPPEKRHQAQALFEHSRGLPADERKALMQRWKAMTPEQRKAWVEAHPPRERPAPR